ncbi:MAG TPA: Crp/Fnr family transcriptional regulator [Flavobacterium sp.]|nr:Crp/Fnr family transcriptional regulator [Flavobacterium sp.]
MPINDFLRYVSTIMPIDSYDATTLINLLRAVSVSKGRLLEKEKRKVDTLYFVVEGYVRVYFVDDGEEITTELVGPGGLVTAFESFVTGHPSRERVSALSDCVLIAIDKASYHQLLSNTLVWRHVCKQTYEHLIQSLRERTLDFRMLTAEQRYQKLLSEQPEVYQNVPLKFIASYLGVTPETLSRIRRCGALRLK